MKNHHMALSPACYLWLLPFPLFKGYRPCLQQIINPPALARLLQIRGESRHLRCKRWSVLEGKARTKVNIPD